MAYEPYNPYQFQQGFPFTGFQQGFQQPRQQQQDLIRVTGMEGARAYQMPPGSRAALFDANEDVFYVKSTDDAGFPTIKAFRFEPLESANPSSDFVTRDELDKIVREMRGMIQDAKQPVPVEADIIERKTRSKSAQSS